MSESSKTWGAELINKLLWKRIVATESQRKEAYDAGAASAKLALAESSNPLMMVDELHEDDLATANAMGWNSVWASDENSKRWAAQCDTNQTAKGKAESLIVFDEQILPDEESPCI